MATMTTTGIWTKIIYPTRNNGGEEEINSQTYRLNDFLDVTRNQCPLVALAGEFHWDASPRFELPEWSKLLKKYI